MSTDICIYVYNTKKKKKLYMINKIFSYSRRGIPLRRKEGRKADWLIVGGLGVEGERARMELGRLRME